MSVSLQITSTRDALVAEIRNQILSGELRPGEPLTETALAARFGVARPTVRSALQVLVGRHLAEQSHGRSLIVPQFDNGDVEDLYFVRIPLEMQGIRAIIENSRPLNEAEHCLKLMEAMPDDASWGVRVETHTAFHVALIDSVGSTRLSRIYASLQDEMQLCLAQLQRWYPNPQDLATEHRLLLDEILSGDIERAQAEMQRHLARAVSNFESDQ
ncbi:GntR family transcriptional regulator [Rhodococcoides kyotonense]|uniref:DNA-binding transcriptional regulator, GntR family n=1 Tax=Rhodococcoides kyotonense TaxID=398843 RepID=A0A239LZ83_9NOCA|nr:GntR family transcriptional regulator [Rhodococcus kyotonensis]SNT35675.1 DNA-binding transcriptional regulator, GntR family [Rhodococcus kyotonensis]